MAAANRISRLRAHGALFAALGVSGCLSVAPLSQPSQDFVGAANALAQAESDYFDEIQAASDAGHQLRGAADYTARNGTFAQIAIELARRDDFSKAKQIRLAALKQLQNYAAAISQIQNGGTATWVADDSKAAIADIDALAGDAGLSPINAKAAGIAQAVVNQLGTAIIDNESSKKIQELAVQAKVPIAGIASMIAEDERNIENDRFASGLLADQTADLNNVLHAIYDDPRAGAADRFQAVQSVVNWRKAVVTKGRTIQAAMAKLEAANDALSKKQSVDAVALAQQAAALAQQALGISSKTGAKG